MARRLPSEYSRTHRLCLRDLRITAHNGTRCTVMGCDNPVTVCNWWRTAVMPATSFFYLCEEHKGHKIRIGGRQRDV